MIDIKNITEAYLKSFPEDTVKQDSAKQDNIDLQNQIKKGNLSAEDLASPTPRESANVLMDQVLPNSEALKEALAREEESVLSKTSWYDFALLQGSGKSAEASVLNRVKRTQTAAGSCVMATELVNPKTNKVLLEKQQAGLRALQAAPATTQQLNASMSTIAETEGARTMMWHPRSEINSKAFKKSIGGSYFGRFGLDQFNGSSVALQLRKIWRDLYGNLYIRSCLMFQFLFISLGFINDFFKIFAVGHYYEIGCYREGFEKFNIPGSTYMAMLAYTFFQLLLCGWIPFYPIIQLCFPSWFAEEGSMLIARHNLLKDWWAGETLDARQTTYLYMDTILPILLYLFCCWRFYLHFKRERGKVNFVAFHLAGFQNLLRQARNISTLVANNPDLEAAYGDRFAKTRALLNTKRGEIGELVYNLEKTKFKNRWYFFNYTGRLLATYKLLQQHKDALADIIYEMGLLDVQLGLIKLMEEHQADKVRNPITFTTFTEAPKDLPKLKAEGVWHPSLESADAVPNDAEMDVERAFFIITGPNAGGKSTYILSLGFNTIFNQAFGIAYAKSFNQTVFYKIITYINVIQDLSKGLSLADAGMEVLRIHKEILTRTKRPMLAIVDEILSGVDPKVAKKYSYEILKRRSPEHPNCLTLVTTHLMNLTELAKEDKRFHNKKVVVNIPGTNGRAFDYTYQIHDGISDQNVVEMMLEDKGVL